MSNLNLLISVNNSYLKKAEIMISSLSINTNDDITVYLLNHSLSEKSVAKFIKKLKNLKKVTVEIIKVKDSFFDTLPLGEMHFSIEMYYRIIAHYLLPKDLDRILWLDADIIVMKDLHDFYYQNFDDCFLAVCADSNNSSEEVKQLKSRLGLAKDYQYFNSGVLLLNLEKIRNQIDLDYIIEVSERIKNALTYPDQDILNCMFRGKVKYCDWKKFNYQVLRAKSIKQSELDNISILHYSGPWKPWDFHFLNSASKFYWKYALKRGYYGEFIFCILKRIAYIVLKRKKS